MNDIWICEASSQKLNVFHVSFKCWSFLRFRYHLHQLRTIHCKQSVANVIQNCLKFFMHYIAQIKASISTWRSERLFLTFLVPNNPSNPGSVLNVPCPEYKSLSFQELSVKYHLSIVHVLVLVWITCTPMGLCWTIPVRNINLYLFKNCL